MDTQKVASVGGMDELLERLEKTRKIRPLSGKAPDGQDFVELPVWFHRTGVRSFEIDSGFGRVKCRVPKYQAPDGKPKAEDEASEDEVIKGVMQALISVPDTLVFEEEARIGAESYKAGDKLPAPDTVRPLPLAHQREYLSHVPRSLPSQVFVGLSLMALPPIPLDPTVLAL